MKSTSGSSTLIVEGNKNVPSVLVASVGVKSEDFKESNFRENIFARLEIKEDNSESRKSLNSDGEKLNRGDLEKTLESRLSFFEQKSNESSVQRRLRFNPTELKEVKAQFVSLLSPQPTLPSAQAKKDPTQPIQVQASAQDEIQPAPDEFKTVQASAQEKIQPAPDEFKTVQASAQEEIQPAQDQPAKTQRARAQILANSSSCCCAGILNYFIYSRKIHPDNSPKIIGAGSLSDYKAKVEIV